MRGRKRFWFILPAAALLLCAGVLPAQAGYTEVVGTTGLDALYAFYVPDGVGGAPWNGDLVVYCHGYWPPDDPVHLPDGVDALRDGLLQMGYAVAWSSYSENGYALKRGVQQTHQLRGLFESQFGQPRRTYIMGHSLGGLIALMLAEKYPSQYDGALPMCGPLGGTRLEAAYVANVRVLFDYFFPGVIPGDVVNVPEGLDFGTQVAPAVRDALIADMATGFEWAGVDQIELPVVGGPDLIMAALHVLGYNIMARHDLLGRTHGHIEFDNMETEYTGCSDDASLNAGVGRFESHPDAVNWMEHYYEPKGDLGIPVLTLHTTRDALVPFWHEAVYAQTAADAGAADMLVQQQVDRFGHCTMNPMETIQAFFGLVAWVEHGIVPPSGDVTIP